MSQTLIGDFRILEIAPQNMKQALYWSENKEKYREFIETKVIKGK
ncbi:MAG: hypothetical protein AAB893_04440 [Patescibacteria group bacterium]